MLTYHLFVLRFRFGYREPGSGRVLQTAYTAGERGFRARGPTIARRMDLSQAKIPYNPPVSPDSPNYNPTYSGYNDPNEDPSYDFAFQTPTYSRKETAGPRGDVSGAYSYIDDAGERHNVQFEAGAQTGFLVKTPYPDSTPYNGLFFRGPDGKPGGPARGRTSIQRGADGSYRFTSSGPDQRRTEVSDAQNNVRGSYTYLDDKGVQRTVQYIAGPNIGYKIINKNVGPNLSPLFPYTRPDYVLPSLNPPIPSKNQNKLPEISPPDLSLPDGSNYGDLFRPGGKPNKPPTPPPFDGDFAGNSPSPVGSPGNDFIPDELFFGSEGPPSSFDSKQGTDKNTDGFSAPADKFPERPPPVSSNKPKPSPLPPKPANPPNEDFLPPLSSFSDNDPPFQNKPFPTPPNTPDFTPDDDFLNKPFSSLPPPSRESRYFNSGKYHKKIRARTPLRSFYIKDNDSESTNFSGFPPGVAVKAHVQSLDINPFGSKIPPPGIALEQHSNKSKRR